MVINLEHAKKIIIAILTIVLYLIIRYSTIIYIPSFTYVNSNPTIPSDTTNCIWTGKTWINPDGDIWKNGEFIKK